MGSRPGRVSWLQSDSRWSHARDVYKKRDLHVRPRILENRVSGAGVAHQPGF